MALALILAGVIVVQLAMLAGLIVLARRTAGTGSFGLSEEEAEAEAYLTNTVERLLQDLQQSADRATAGLAAQRAALEALLSQAEPLQRSWAAAEPTEPAGGGAPDPVGVPEARPVSGWVGEVVQLAGEGLAPIEIARRVGRGEVEVRLALTRGETG